MQIVSGPDDEVTTLVSKGVDTDGKRRRQYINYTRRSEKIVNERKKWEIKHRWRKKERENGARTRV